MPGSDRAAVTRAPGWLAGLTVLQADEHLVTLWAGYLLRLMGANVVAAARHRAQCEGGDRLYAVLQTPLAGGERAGVVIGGPPSQGHTLPADLPVARGALGRLGGEEWHAASELTLQAAAGWPQTNGDQARGLDPMRFPGYQATFFCGNILATLAIAAARIHRRHGVRQEYVLDLREAALLANNGFAFSSYTGIHSSRFGVTTSQPSAVMHCADGPLFLSCSEDWQFKAVIQILGSPEWGASELFATPEGRFQNWDALSVLLQDALGARRRTEIVEACAPLGIATVAAYTLPEVLATEHFRERGTLAVAGPRGAQLPGLPLLARPMNATPRPAPAPPSATVGGLPVAPPIAPLEGVLVADMSRVWVGGTSSQLLASLGATVVKMESRKHPDVFRRGMPFGQGVRDVDASSAFNHVNQGKLDIVLECDDPADMALVKRVIARADVFQSNFRPGHIEAFGLRETLDAHPSIVEIASSGYGESGPWAPRGLLGYSGQMVAGFAMANTSPGGQPQVVGGPYGDPLTATYAAFATVAALFHRDQAGQGWHIDMSMCEALALSMTDLLAESAETGAMPQRGNRSPDVCPQGVFRCAGDDRWLALTIRHDGEWAALVDLAGFDPAWRSWDFAARRAHEDEAEAAIAAWLAHEERDIAARTLRANAIPAAAAVGSLEIVHDPDLIAAGHIQAVYHPRAGVKVMRAVPWKADGVRMVLPPPPMLDEHRSAILQLIEA